MNLRLTVRLSDVDHEALKRLSEKCDGNFAEVVGALAYAVDGDEEFARYVSDLVRARRRIDGESRR